MNSGRVNVSGGLINSYFRDTRLMGAAAQVITLVSGIQVVRYNALNGAAGELGIDDALLDKALHELHGLDQVRIVEERTGNHRIEVRTRQVGDRYEVIGARWRDLSPTGLEEIALDMLDSLALVPQYESDLRDRYDLDSEDFDIVKGIMDGCAVLGSYISPVSGRTILYSPLYWEDNPKSFFDLQDLHGADDVLRAMNAVRTYQGLSEDKVTDIVLRAAVDTGVLPTVTVTSSNGPKRFLFTPQQRVRKIDKQTAKKAFALIACIRYGQHHARITRLKWPALELLRRLKDVKRIGPHSEALNQYSPLIELMMGRIEKDQLGKYTFYLYDSPDNMAALNLAIELSSLGEVRPHSEATDRAHDRLLLPSGSFHDQDRTRIDIKKSIKRTTSTTNRVAAIISGVTSDIV
jgi:hypothetical protein